MEMREGIAGAESAGSLGAKRDEGLAGLRDRPELTGLKQVNILPRMVWVALAFNN